MTVTTGLNIVGGTNGSFSFKVATPFGTFTPLKLPMVPAGVERVQYFHSQPSLEPASVTVNQRSSAAYNGDIFLTPQYGPLQNGPMILDPSGESGLVPPAADQRARGRLPGPAVRGATGADLVPGLHQQRLGPTARA